MAISNVDICNVALNHLGQRAITALTEQSNEARKCNLIFNIARDSVLRSHDWSFAAKTEALAVLSETFIGWDFLYARPSNCLFIRRIFNEGNVNDNIPNEFKEVKSTIGQKAIATNTDLAYIEYTIPVTDPNDYDPNFVEAFTFKLASMLCKSLTGDLEMMKVMDALFQQSIPEAKRVNKGSNYRKPSDYSSYLAAR
jgi:hypothetical protein